MYTKSKLLVSAVYKCWQLLVYHIDTDICMHLVHLPNNVCKCTKLHSPSIEYCFYCLKGLSAIVAALLGDYTQGKLVLCKQSLQ